MQPEFPREAVTRVEILEATPRRLFDRTLVRHLSQWKFDGGSEGRTVEVDIDFQR